MLALFNLFLDICLLRKGPQDVPASVPLVKMCLLAYGLSGLLVLLLSTPVPVALLQILLEAAFELVHRFFNQRLGHCAEELFRAQVQHASTRVLAA